MVTAPDVISKLLVALNREVERLEIPAEPEQNQKAERVIEFKTEPFNFEIAGQASTGIKKTLKAAGVDPQVTRRIGIASYELEINQVVHSEGGVMRYFISPDKLVIEAADRGPGIPDIEKAMTEGFSTATDRVRALGFGAGMGLPNTKRVSDEFHIESSAEKGTLVRSTFNLKGTASRMNTSDLELFLGAKCVQSTFTDRAIEGAYTSDLLSDAIAHCPGKRNTDNDTGA